jgi:hypothetical protein
MTEGRNMIAGLYDLEETIGELSYGTYEHDTRKQYHSRVIPQRRTGVLYKIDETAGLLAFIWRK